MAAGREVVDAVADYRQMPAASGLVRMADRLAAALPAPATSRDENRGRDENLALVKEIDMADRLGAGWTLGQRAGDAETQIWLVLHHGRIEGAVRRYRRRTDGNWSKGWEAFLSAAGTAGPRHSATKAGSTSDRSSFLWRSRDLAAWGIATRPAFQAPKPRLGPPPPGRDPDATTGTHRRRRVSVASFDSPRTATIGELSGHGSQLRSVAILGSCPAKTSAVCRLISAYRFRCRTAGTYPPLPAVDASHSRSRRARPAAGHGPQGVTPADAHGQPPLASHVTS